MKVKYLLFVAMLLTALQTQAALTLSNNTFSKPDCGGSLSNTWGCSTAPVVRVTGFDALLTSSFDGGFNMDGYVIDPHPELSLVEYGAGSYSGGYPAGTAAFAFDSATTFFYGGHGGAYDGAGPGGGFEGSNAGMADSIAHFTMPTLVKNADVTSIAGFNSATQLQPWTSVFKSGNNLTEVGGGNTITDIFYDSGDSKLCVTTGVQYDDSPPYSEDNLICYTTPSDLDTSAIEGFYQLKPTGETDMGAHVSTWISDVPTAWQTALGGNKLFGGGANFSIVSRLPSGPTLFGGTLDSLPSDPATDNDVIITRHMDFKNTTGQQMGSYLYDGIDDITNWYNIQYFNCDPDVAYQCGNGIADYLQIVGWENDFWNILSFGATGFILPGTKTYVVIGTLHGREDGIGYKITPPWRSQASGPSRVGEFDLNNYYWLFDIDDILAATNPYEIMPYERGELTFLDNLSDKDGDRAQISNAAFDLSTGRLAIVMKYMHGGSLPKASVFIFSNTAWSE